MSEPRTEAGRRLLSDWLDLKVKYAPNTARVRDTILAIEAECAKNCMDAIEASSSDELRAALDEDALYDAIVSVVGQGTEFTRQVARDIAAEYATLSSEPSAEPE